jgi:hypothetical protein
VPPLRLRLKVEINSREHFSARVSLSSICSIPTAKSLNPLLISTPASRGILSP